MKKKLFTTQKKVKASDDNHLRFQQWCNEKGATFKWETYPNGNWEINFQTNDISFELKTEDEIDNTTHQSVTKQQQNI